VTEDGIASASRIPSASVIVRRIPPRHGARSPWHPWLVNTQGQPEEHQPSAAIACALGEADLSTRQNRWLQLGQRATTDVVTTANGLRLLFRVAPGVEEELRQLAELERDCCAFAEWSVHARGEELALDVTADSEEGIAAVQAMFDKLRSALATTG
jgi:hypothetical protein